MYLVDTDVLSELRNKARNPGVERWMKAQRPSELYLSVVTIGEVERGILQQQGKNPKFVKALADWLDKVLMLYGDHVLSIDLATARRWGKLSAEIGNDSADLLIAATALEHGLTVVTRNVRHFKPTGASVFNPYVA